MFESVELGQQISKATYKEAVDQLRSQLITAQIACQNAPGPIIVLISGMDGAGKGELVNALGDMLDMRNVMIRTFWETSDEERQRPDHWRFWRHLPGRGQIGIFFGAWYTDPMRHHVEGNDSDLILEHDMRRIVRLEKMLADDHALILKFWLHLSPEAQKKKHQNLKKKHHESPEMIKRAMWHFDHYPRIRDAAEQTIRHTDRAHARWHLIDASHKRHRQLRVFTILHKALQAFTTQSHGPVVEDSVMEVETAPVLDSIDLSQKLARDDYRAQLEHYQKLLQKRVWQAYKQRLSTILLFEGWDASGKGGSIRRAANAMDPRLVQQISIGAPTDEEKDHHYLWRFWRHLPRSGMVTIYDRSWYGRTLVERVEGFAHHAEWNRAFEEINEFEQQLIQSPTLLLKFWLHIDPDEQLRRFKEREVTPWKQHKITDEDWRNRDRWQDYERAANEMISRTSTREAPWHLIAANDKKFARIEVLRHTIEQMERLLDEVQS
jgi:polyphosphate:AMP phosphotransferase